MTDAPRDHGGGVDAALRRWGGSWDDWMDLSTGINPRAWPLPELPEAVWRTLPDRGAEAGLIAAARTAWSVPAKAEVLAAPGASALIAQMPFVLGGSAVQIRRDTYNEHAAAFRAAGFAVDEAPGAVRVIVNPNNPTGDFAQVNGAATTVLDESFCDTDPGRSLIHLAGPGCTVLKSFGKFWGLAGLRLGFAIGAPEVIAALRQRLGPWPVAGPALAIGTAALADTAWATHMRQQLRCDAARLDTLLRDHGLVVRGDCPLFRLVRTPRAADWHAALARQHILTRVFPYAASWLRIGLPPADGWDRLASALEHATETLDSADRGTVGGAMAQPSAVQRPASP